MLRRRSGKVNFRWTINEDMHVDHENEKHVLPNTFGCQHEKHVGCAARQLNEAAITAHASWQFVANNVDIALAC